MNEFLIFISVKGLEDIKEELTPLEKAFRYWYFINRPEYTVEGAYDSFNVKDIQLLRRLKEIPVSV